jgi:hypothetical protein
VVEILSGEGLERLRRYAAGGRVDQPLPGFWSCRDLGRRAPGSPTPPAGAQRTAP